MVTAYFYNGAEIRVDTEYMPELTNYHSRMVEAASADVPVVTGAGTMIFIALNISFLIHA